MRVFAVYVYLLCTAAALDAGDDAPEAGHHGNRHDTLSVHVERNDRRTTQARLDAPEVVHMPCSEYAPFVGGCHVRDRCQRHIIDDFAEGEVLEALRDIATQGMATSPLHGGPVVPRRPRPSCPRYAV